MQTTPQKSKNVAEELKEFLENNSEAWYTNDQLADQLQQFFKFNCSTPSGIRNAITKLKGTGLIKTCMVGSLAYRSWHSAPEMQLVPSPDSKKNVRSCNGCGTTFSRYWRSDLEEKNGWLCNNCGMNQRRGRGINRVTCNHSDDDQDYYDCAAPSAEPSLISPTESQSSMEIDQTVTKTPTKRIYPHIDPSRRKCAHCHTGKSAGKWRRDREFPERYLCNKCGMNQRRAQLRAEQARLAAENGEPIKTKPYRCKKSARINPPPCSLCNEPLPTYLSDACQHRICGECIPVLLRRVKTESVDCTCCSMQGSRVRLIVADLGAFVDSL